VKILMVTAEYAPPVKVGGLADMVASLSAALVRRGHDVSVALPRYAHLDGKDVRPLQTCPPFHVRLAGELAVGRLQRLVTVEDGVKVYVADGDGLFKTPGIYLGPDGTPPPRALERKVFHCQAALRLPTLLGWRPDVVHCHDAASALAAVYLRRSHRRDPYLAGAGSLLTIHNLAHQEILPPDDLEVLDLPADMAVYPGSLEFHGQLNLMKAGILEADLVNTVSPTYAREVVEDPWMGQGLGGVLKGRGADFSGILNGADLEAWDPAGDPHLPAAYDAQRLEGKRRCRAALLKEMGLRPGPGPVLGLVTRLVEQKGLDMLLPVLDRAVAAGCALAVLGTGERRYEEALVAAAGAHPGRVAAAIRFDEGLAHRIVAGADVFLMPSRFEPCGLTQMYALRYGTPPLVRRTGGLADTVTDAAEPDGDGFVFDGDDPWPALARAVEAFADPDRWRALQRRGMARDFSWDRSAFAYEDLYRRLGGREADADG
jgi:starch synthase